jgi:Zn-dependent protease
MRGSLRVGRVARVPLSVHWSLLVVLALVAVGLDRGLLPSAAPGSPGAVDLLAGVAGAVGFAVAIVFHEVGHAVVARRQGLAVSGVTIWALGGFTEVEGEPSTPGAELALAGIGPLVSLVLGGLLVAAALVTSAAGGPQVAAATIGWLGGLNVLLALLNALPAAPLDGGRLLHAVVWKVTGDDRRAVLLSTAAGQVLGWLAVAGGFVLLLAGSVEGLWIAVTGMFLTAGAQAQRQQAALTAVVGRRPVGAVMQPLGEPWMPDWWDVETALRSGGDVVFRPVVVLQDWHGRPSGIVSPWALAQVPPAVRRDVRVRQLAWPLAAVVATDPGEEVLTLLRRWPAGAQWAVAFRGGRPVGALALADLEAAVDRWLTPPSRRFGAPGWGVSDGPRSAARSGVAPFEEVAAHGQGHHRVQTQQAEAGPRAEQRTTAEVGR